jgi:hypothetical protein
MNRRVFIQGANEKKVANGSQSCVLPLVRSSEIGIYLMHDVLENADQTKSRDHIDRSNRILKKLFTNYSILPKQVIKIPGNSD